MNIWRALRGVSGTRYVSAIILFAIIIFKRIFEKAGAVGMASGQAGILTGPSRQPQEVGTGRGTGSERHRRTLVVSKCIFLDRNGSTI